VRLFRARRWRIFEQRELNAPLGSIDSIEDHVNGLAHREHSLVPLSDDLPRVLVKNIAVVGK
jgi:hypothetical protein